jgi:UDP-3-O-[3-hydroxymyristoyl] N-acetylglucosamine deacetylase
MEEKKTLQKEVFLSGVGVHSGKNVNLALKPSDSGEIVFRRSDLDNLEVSIDPRQIEAKNSTSFVSEDCRIQTIEHLMATLFMFGIDSLIVELDNTEIPMMDGSALPFVEAVLQAGIKLLPLNKKAIQILKPFVLQEEDASISFFPDSDFKMTYLIDFTHPAIKKQELSLALNLEIFSREIAPARTFGFLKDVERLRSQGLALGGSLENALVLDDEKVINGPLRFPDEFVRHKILDLIGDLSLLGSPLLGHFKAEKAGHSLHLRAVQFLLDSPEFWAYEK